jgi:hypothetical protein
MKTKNMIIWVMILIVIVIVATIAWPHARPPATSAPAGEQSTGQLIATAAFFCDGGRTINAAFYAGTSTSSTDPSQPPVPGGSVALILSDGRSMTLPHAVSADGGRYANAGESIVFWNTGDTAFITENSVKTYANCAIPSGNSTTSAQ